jgi:hypothetical protein
VWNVRHFQMAAYFAITMSRVDFPLYSGHYLLLCIICRLCEEYHQFRCSCYVGVMPFCTSFFKFTMPSKKLFDLNLRCFVNK